MAVLVVVSPGLYAAIGCTLTNPSEDLKYLYPEMTSYKEDIWEFSKLKDGRNLFGSMADRLGSSLDPIYETYETAYTVYTVFKGKTPVGIVHGVNVRGRGGVIQVFLSMDPTTAEIRSFFFQRLESPSARQLRSKDFRSQFEGVTLSDFYKHDVDVIKSNDAGEDRIAAIKAPVLDPASKPDYEAAIRGIRKNLVLLDLFVYGQKFESSFKAMRQAMTSRKGSL